MVPALVPHALTIAILGGIESLLSAVVADGMTGRRHRSNMELIAQGVANIVIATVRGNTCYRRNCHVQPQTSRTGRRRRYPA